MISDGFVLFSRRSGIPGTFPLRAYSAPYTGTQTTTSFAAGGSASILAGSGEGSLWHGQQRAEVHDVSGYGKGFGTEALKVGAGPLSFCRFQMLLVVFLGFLDGFPILPALF